MGAGCTRCSQGVKKASNKTIKILTKKFSSTSKENPENQDENINLNVLGNENIKDYYKVGPLIGQGNSCIIRKVQHLTTKEIRVVKILKKSQIQNWQQFLFELSLLFECNHPNIVHFYECFQDSKYIYIVNEYCRGGELFNVILKYQNFTEIQAANYFQQIISALSYCHQKGICHKYIRPENILLTTKEKNAAVKVSNFCTSSYKDLRERAKNQPQYFAPEVFRGKCDDKSDLWAIGVVLYVMLIGHYPFQGADIEMIRNIIKFKLVHDTQEWNSLSKEARNLIKNLLKPLSIDRCSAEKALKHPWLQGKIEKPRVEKSILSKKFNNLQKFYNAQNFQKSVLTFIVCTLSTQEERVELEKVFNNIDKNSDGKLSYAELKDGYCEIFGEVPEKELKKIFQSCDIDNSGFIDYSEFVTACLDTKLVLSEEKIKHAFKMLDTDKNGQISIIELKQVKNVTGNNPAIFDHLITTLEKKETKEFDYEEFKEFMIQILNEEHKNQEQENEEALLQESFQQNEIASPFSGVSPVKYPARIRNSIEQVDNSWKAEFENSPSKKRANLINKQQITEENTKDISANSQNVK